MTETFADPTALTDPVSAFLAGHGEAAELAPSHERTHPEVVKIGVALAAAILVGRKLMVAGLSEEPAPESAGAASKLAGRVWRKVTPAWLQITVPVLQRAYQLGANRITYGELEPLASAYAEDLGDYLAETSAEAMAEGYAAQLNAGWHPVLAWQRSAYGWGLDKKQTRTYVMALLKGDKAAYTVDPVSMATKSAIDRLLLHRADRLGLTEAYRANQLGKSLSWLVLEQAGQLPPGMRKKWVTAADEKVCGVCGALDGQTVPLRRRFQTPAGEKFYAPGVHPNCRCWLELVYPDLGDDVVKNAPGDPYDRNAKGQFARKEERRPQVAFKEREAALDPALAELLRQAAARTTPVDPGFSQDPGFASYDPGFAAEDPGFGDPGFATEDPGFGDPGFSGGGRKPPGAEHHFFLPGGKPPGGQPPGPPQASFHAYGAVYYADPWMLYQNKGEYRVPRVGEEMNFDLIEAYAESDPKGPPSDADPFYEGTREAFAGYLAGWTRTHGSADPSEVDEVVFSNENYSDAYSEESIMDLPYDLKLEAVEQVVRANHGKKPHGMPWSLNALRAHQVEDEELAIWMANECYDEVYGKYGDGVQGRNWRPFTTAILNVTREWGLDDAGPAVAAMDADATAAVNEPTVFHFVGWHGEHDGDDTARITGAYEVVQTSSEYITRSELEELRHVYAGNFEAQRALSDFAKTKIRYITLAPLPAPSVR